MTHLATLPPCHLATYAAAQAGFLLLLFSIARHQKDWLRRKLAPHRTRQMRMGGFGLLILAFLIAVGGLGWGYGAVVYPGWLSIAAAAAVTINSYREDILMRVRP